MTWERSPICVTAIVSQPQATWQEDGGDVELLSVYVPTNHIYIGDIFLLQRADVIRTSLSVREGLGAAPAHDCRAFVSLRCCNRAPSFWASAPARCAGSDRCSVMQVVP